jgi:ubiquinol-cytochrome c reductase cytochrome b subunit
MAGIPHDHYEPGSKGEKWLHSRLPIVGLLYDTLMLPTPKNLNWMWIWGIVLTFCLALQIITGIVLAMHYTPHVDEAFASVEHIMRNVNGGHMLRYLHANGASLFFIAVYAHIFRGLYYGSYKAPREVTWIIGMLIYLLMMGTAFMGYVLPWGQMSFWGATVITNLFSAIPLIGDQITLWLWGGFSVDNATLNRFFSLHYLMPFAIAGLSLVHLTLLHQDGSSNPLGVDSTTEKISFGQYFLVKDVFGWVVFFAFFSFWIYFAPNSLGHPDNYIPANPLVTPAHIVPEWYFLPFYAILRSIPDKLGGVLAMFGAIAILYTIPYTQSSEVQRTRFRPIYRILFWLFVADFLILLWIGQQIVEEPFVTVGQVATVFYFAFFLVVIPGLGYLERYLIRYNH